VGRCFLLSLASPDRGCESLKGFRTGSFCSKIEKMKDLPESPDKSLENGISERKFKRKHFLRKEKSADATG
jgi:hypothetical protein